MAKPTDYSAQPGLRKEFLLFVTFAFLVLLPSADGGAGQTEYYGLVEKLFSQYNKNVRPTTDGEGTVVKINMILKSIVNLDEQEQILETFATLEIEWNDDYLQWNTSDYGNITRFLYPQKEMWLPDIINENSVESQVQLGYDQLKCAISSNGQVSWQPSEIFKTACDIDVTYYPFDTQTCFISFSTMMSASFEIDIDPFAINGNVDLDDYAGSSVWELTSTRIETPNVNDNFTRIQFVLELKRLRLYYVVNLLLPVLLLSATSFMVFYLPAESGEKVGMGITVLLSYTVYLTIVAEKMPETSQQVSLLGVYITILLCLSSLSVILSVVVLNIHHRDPAIPIAPHLVLFIRYWRLTLGLGIPRDPPSCNKNQIQPEKRRDGHVNPRMCRPVARKGIEQGIISGGQANKDVHKNNAMYPDMDGDDDDLYDQDEEITWPKVAQTLDRLFLAGFIIIVFATTLILLPLMVILVES